MEGDADHAQLQLGQWHHVAVTTQQSSASTVDIFLDGLLVMSQEADTADPIVEAKAEDGKDESNLRVAAQKSEEARLKIMKLMPTVARLQCRTLKRQQNFADLKIVKKLRDMGVDDLARVI